MTSRRDGRGLVVIGGGPAGVSAALQARELGAKVTLIERGRIGGTALNAGPAPVRTLARAARLARDWSSWESFGLSGPPPEVDIKALLENAERVATYAHRRRHISDEVKAHGVELVEDAGRVHFTDAATVKAEDGREWTADRFVIAVGGRARRLPIPGAEFALTFEDIRSLERLPDRVCIVGAADTGCQLASILADFGCAVWLLENEARVLPRADEDVSRGLSAAFRRRGIEVATNSTVREIERLAAGLRVKYDTQGVDMALDVDAVFFAVGWPSNSDHLGVAAAGVAVERGYIAVDEFLCTSVPSIYAAGDVNGRSMLVSSALVEGRVAAENAVMGPRRRLIHEEVVPTGSFTNPEYGSVGLTEAQARDRFDCAVAVGRYEDLLRPVADGQPEGFCKLIIERASRRILGAHVLGEYSAEVIQMVAACMAGGMRIEAVAELHYSFPTFTEGVGLAATTLVRDLGVRAMPQLWGRLNDPSALEAII